jgi:diketogulonate reductase-like aldo/keto reductase
MTTHSLPTLTLPERRAAAAETVPKLGQGTWGMGERRARRAEETAALRRGIELGMTLIDTAEMYGEGATESWLGDALEGLRDEVFLVSKVYPHNASRPGVQQACERSLKRLRTDRLDLYLLHWRGGVPLAETIAGFEALIDAGKIRRWGVSNLDTDDMEELFSLSGGEQCTINQILYNVARRGPEFDLLPWFERHDVPELAQARGITPQQLALAWVLKRDAVCAIPKASTVAHVEANRAAADLTLDALELAAIDAHFPPPHRKVSLEML